MTAAFRLLADVARGRTAPRALVWGVLNKLNFLLKTGNRRFEFERLYLQEGDPWDYHTSPYETAKYERVLKRLLQLRPSDESLLEVGCSIGVFSKTLAANFKAVVGIDVSSEAVRIAAADNRTAPNIKFQRGDFAGLRLGRTFDVILCSEVLYYIKQRDVGRVVQRLDEHLSGSGVIVTVGGIPSEEPNPYHFDSWEDVLANRFDRVLKEQVQDPLRPYEIIAYRRRAPNGGRA